MKNLILSTLAVYVLLASCKKEIKNAPGKVVSSLVFKNVVILGNSITYAPENKAEGWNCGCGMAASAPDKDYVHILTARFKAINDSSRVTAKNIAAFEAEYATYNLDLNLSALRNLKPDLLVLRIGENVPSNFDQAVFEQQYVSLINYFRAGNPNLRVLGVGSIWSGKDAVDAIMSKHSPFITLKALGADTSNFAFGLYTNYSIETHPGDKGMLKISDAMWAAVEVLQ